MTWVTLAGFLAATFGAGATGAFFKPGAWYSTLRKPGWTPPDWLFPIAWTTLYISMAIAAWRVAGTPSPWTPAALALWSWQIVMNALWSPIFFGLHRLGQAFAVLSLLWLSVVLTALVFFQVDRIAGLLFLPYIAWVSVAGALNFTLWRMNRTPSTLVAARTA